MEMEKRKVVICVLLSLLGLLSALTALAAEATKLKRSQIKVSTSDSHTICSYPRSPAAYLAFTSALLLMIAQIIASIESGFSWCRQGPAFSTSNCIIVLMCLKLSWFSYLIASYSLLTGSALNNRHTVVYSGNGLCDIVKPGVFSTCSVLSIVTVALGIIYYLCLNSSEENVAGSMAVNQGGGIAMGEAQIPERIEDPVFVHEDTYMRRQFT